MPFSPAPRVARRVAATLLSAALAATGLLSSLPPAANAAPSVTSSATVAPSPVAAGNSTTITATISSAGALSALVDVEVYDPSGAKTFQQAFDNQSFGAGQSRAFPVTWSVPASAALGTYVVKLGVFAPGWASLYQWNDAAAQVQVTKPAPPSFSTTGTTSPTSLAAGASVTLGASITSATATSALIDLEVYDPSGARTFQQAFDNQRFAAGQRRDYSSAWQVPAGALAGSYVLKVGVFSPGWATTYAWNDHAAQFSVSAPAAAAKDFGVNISGAEFTETHLPGVLNTDYLYAADASRQSYFAGKGLKLVRVPFRWERLQPTAYGPLSAADVAGLRSMLDVAQAAGQHVILDMHNYARYYDTPLTVADAAKLNDAWQKIAQTFRGHPALYGYELMNEPHDLPEGSDGWASLAQSATNAIRQVDSQAYVLVPGYSWQGAWTWPQANPNLHVNDPAGRLLYAAHQYFDPDGSGTYTASYDADGAYPTIGVDRVQPFLNWLSTQHARGILTEYGVPGGDARWQTVLDNFLSKLNADADIQGGTYWSAGPWWGSYPLSVEPSGGVDKPQMAVLAKYPSHP